MSIIADFSIVLNLEVVMIYWTIGSFTTIFRFIVYGFKTHNRFDRTVGCVSIILNVIFLLFNWGTVAYGCLASLVVNSLIQWWIEHRLLRNS